MPSLGIAPSPEGCDGDFTRPSQGWHRFQASFPADVNFHLLEIGIEAIKLSPYHAGPQSTVPTPGTRPLVSWHALAPFTFRIQVSHQTQEPPFEFLPAGPGDTTERLVAHWNRSILPVVVGEYGAVSR
jgi:hypothetical protein